MGGLTNSSITFTNKESVKCFSDEIAGDSGIVVSNVNNPRHCKQNGTQQHGEGAVDFDVFHVDIGVVLVDSFDKGNGGG